MQASGSTGVLEAASRYSLVGKNCLVTGGTKGIGRAVVEELAKLGAKVHTCSRSQEDVDALVNEWSTAGLPITASVADVSSRGDCQQLVDEVRSRFNGHLHLLVNNVGTNIRKTALEYTEADFETIVTTNMESAFSLSQLTHPLLKASGNGCIIFISSVAGGPTANRAGPLYAMSKAAINQLTKNLALEWASDSIRVNSVAPWVTLTELGMQNLQDEEWKVKVLSRTPLGRLALPEDIAGVVAFLAGPSATYITGQTIAVDGGYSVMGFW